MSVIANFELQLNCFFHDFVTLGLGPTGSLTDTNIPSVCLIAPLLARGSLEACDCARLLTVDAQLSIPLKPQYPLRGTQDAPHEATVPPAVRIEGKTQNFLDLRKIRPYKR